MEQEKLTPDEFAKTITGFEELAIVKMFGKSIEELAGMLPIRAFVFVQEKRKSNNDHEAYNIAMGMSLGDSLDRFAEVVTEDEEDPLDQ